MRKFTINCDFGGQMAPFAIYIGKPEQKHHPLHFQADWLSKNRGGMIPAEVMDAVGQLQELAKKNNVSLEELCVYALSSEDEDQQSKENTEQEINNDIGDEMQNMVSSTSQDSDAELDNILKDYDEDFLVTEYDDDDKDDADEDADDEDDFDEREAEEDMASEGGHVEEDMVSHHDDETKQNNEK